MICRILVVTAVAAESDSVAAGLTTARPGPDEGLDADTGAYPDAGQGAGAGPQTGMDTGPGADTGAAPEAGPGTSHGTATSPGTGPSASPLPGGYLLRHHGRTSPVDVPVDVLVGGVGPAAAAAAAATALACAHAQGRPYDLVVSAGIAGGFLPHAPIGTVVVSDAVVAADLGAQTPDGYLAVEELGFGRSAHPVAPELTGAVAKALADGGLPHAVGPVLTVSTVTGTAERAVELARRHPGAVAEAMEGFGVAEAAAAYGVPVVEIRAVSNAVGPRDRAAWRIGQALDALRRAFQLIGRTVFTEPEES
ncbi:futalosine hydrolase [Streptomyces roseicoloratus]|uniref:Futalosine hydrolase n=1 Tax=Streptomyces roseicoloratus TaxID=2508722 RepID=A0ABY9RU77_9ACTN|nr:futalosine hydrolase [Streptomyces roseicoloratus]WMX45741.1 futalosine hydrolase [Streptomyces roseicoloratus]